MAKKGLSKRVAGDNTFLKIGDVANMVGISATAIRSWEKLGLIRPQRTSSQYRLYTADDVKLLKRARFLRRERGLNAPAIVESLRRGGDLPFIHQSPQNGNGAPKLGAMLRRLRTERGLSLSEVAQKAEISVGFLSAIERSHMTASVATLRKLARFYKINILDLFQPSESNPYLVRPADRKVLAGGKGVRMELLAWGNTAMEPHLFRIAPGAGSGESYSHHGEEFLHVIRGEFEIVIAGQKHTLKAGDSLYFDSSMPHAWKNPGKSESSVLWVNTPPTF
jgi:DNA-binding transcriptional MerR regulator/mannose-6-phosphate isomerase-like protein (cupin superfamily)